MRIAVIGPRHQGGSLPPYLDVFAAALRRCGQQVHRIGSRGVPFDTGQRAFWPAERILDAAEGLLRRIDLGAYDILSVHFGNLEIEQLLPVLWETRRHPPAIYHVHSLDWTLFAEHRPAPGLRAAVMHGVASMDGFVCFGEYAERRFSAMVDTAAPRAIAWLPTTIPPTTRPSVSPGLATALSKADQRSLGSLYGYAAPWKDVRTLLVALRRLRLPLRVVLAGPFWDDPDQAGTDIERAADRLASRHGAALTVVPEYLDKGARRAMVDASQFGLFVYRPQSTFQGSGAIADYLAHAVPVIATDVANMAELIGDSGMIVRPADPVAVADALHRLTLDRQTRNRLQAAARRRAYRFTAVHHAAACLRFYENVVATTRNTGATRWQARQCCSLPATAKPIATSTRSSAVPPDAEDSRSEDAPRSDSSPSGSVNSNTSTQSVRSTQHRSAEHERAVNSSLND